MRGFAAAPLLALAGAFFLGIALPGILPVPVSIGASILLLAGAAGCGWMDRPRSATALLLFAACAAGAANRPIPPEQGPLRAAVDEIGPERLKRPVRLAGTLTRSPEDFSDRTALRLRVEEIHANRRRFHALGFASVQVAGEHRHLLRDLARGSQVEVWARVARRRPPGNPGGREASGPVGLFGNAKSALLVVETRPAPAFHRLIRRLRLGIRDRFLDADVSRKAAAVLVAILIGDRTLAAGDVVRSFRDAGTLHVMAVSGLHVGLVSLLLYGALLLLGTGRRAALTLILILLPLYAALSGGSPSVLRATLMASAVILGIRFGIAGSPLNGIGLAALLLLAWDPWNASDVGFQLSFAATLAIVAVLGKRRDPAEGAWDPPGRWRRLGRWGSGAVAVTLAAQLGVFPVVAWHFHRVVLAAIPASVPATLLAGPLLGFGFGWLLLGSVPLIGPLLLAGAGLAAEALLAVSAWGAALPFATSGIAAPGWPFLAAWFALALAVLAVRGRMVWLPSLALLGMALLLAPRATGGDGALRVTALDVGMGDALALGLPAGGSVVVDAGAAYGDFSAGERVVAPFLFETGGLPVRAAVATHGDLDHIGGFFGLFREVRAHSFWRGDGLVADRRPAVDSLRRDIRRREIPTRLLRTGEEFAFGGAWFRVLFADPPVAPGSTNEGSLVLMVEYAGVRTLLTGDAGAPTERLLLERHRDDLAADVLKVGHHGSRFSTVPEFLEAVRPRIAIVSAREDERRRLPDPEVLRRLRARGARVLRTDRDGAVTVRIGPDGTLSVRAYRSSSSP